jgi:pteridine reductase
MTENAELQNRTVLITGAARRVGAAVARHLHTLGANVAVHYRSSAGEAQSLIDELNKKRRGSAILIAADLLDCAQLAPIVTRTVEAFGRLDILINNASTFYPTPIGSITEKQWDDLFGTNLKAPLFLAQAAAPELRKHSGLIVNMVDIHAQRPLPEHPVYCAAKAGLVMLTRSLARELGPEVRVNAIAPGPILWPEHGMESGLQDEIIDKTALKRMGSPQDIARAIAFFAIEAPYVTGQILAVDGGRSIGW